MKPWENGVVSLDLERDIVCWMSAALADSKLVAGIFFSVAQPNKARSRKNKRIDPSTI